MPKYKKEVDLCQFLAFNGRDMNKTTKEKIHHVKSFILSGKETNRGFDSCLEDDDADQVCEGVVKLSLKNEDLAEALPRYITQNSIDFFTRQLIERDA